MMPIQKNLNIYFKKYAKTPSLEQVLKTWIPPGPPSMVPHIWATENGTKTGNFNDQIKILLEQAEVSDGAEGLKGDVDFNNQLNTIYLDDTLNSGVPYGLNLIKIQPILPTDLISTLKELTPGKTNGLFIKSKADGVLDLLQKSHQWLISVDQWTTSLHTMLH